MPTVFLPTFRPSGADRRAKPRDPIARRDPIAVCSLGSSRRSLATGRSTRGRAKLPTTWGNPHRSHPGGAAVMPTRPKVTKVRHWGRRRRKVPWGRHSRPLFAKYRSDQRSPWVRLAHFGRAAKRAPCAFTETAVKRALRAVRAAGETPGRIVVTKDGFAIELGDGSATTKHPIPPPADEENLWDKKLLIAAGPDHKP